jgi:hypothetical protein
MLGWSLTGNRCRSSGADSAIDNFLEFERRCETMGLRSQVGSAIRQLRIGCIDTTRNLRFARSAKRFLVVRHNRHPVGYEVLIRWVRERYPSLRGLFELRLLPCRVRDWSPYTLHVPWVKDPVQKWSPTAYAQAMQLAAECDARGIPVINRVDRLANAGKMSGAQLIATAGFRTPRMASIPNVEEFRATLCGLSYPLVVREDWGHGKAMYRVETSADLQRIPFEKFSRPIAVEYIDVRSDHDGLYRKFRYLAVGEEGIPLHMHATRDWISRGEQCEQSAIQNHEERAFIEGGAPHHEQFQQARRALGLDFVAFDFSYDRDGQLVVWEANPFPYIHFPRPGGNRAYRAPGVERAMAAMLKLYLERAGLAVPESLARSGCTNASACR